ncbi:asl8512 (plasmid) [Nostoc sp. PCC 7120 = FACHB-418]|nr:asl8512 [Nostoc sp. PCC 7120 = FACHB-418]
MVVLIDVLHLLNSFASGDLCTYKQSRQKLDSSIAESTRCINFFLRGFSSKS